MNRLAQEASLYLRQHAHNPVHWFPWGKEAMEEAVRRDLPLFISIGYSSCHWCHVMERESFEDPEIARILNENFVAIKVDREEHPDVDALYMQACLLIHGHGGWPLNVFAFPDGLPFFAGTYYPPRFRPGQIGFDQLLMRIAELWKTNRKGLESDANSLMKAIRSLGELPGSSSLKEVAIPDLARLEPVTLHAFDPVFGGARGAPKFPPHETLESWYHLLIHRKGTEKVRSAFRLTLDRMNFGGLRDQISGGYHRYCVDEAWQVPHFEKMLYDQARFLHHLSHAIQIFADPIDLFCLGQLLDELFILWISPTGLYSSAFDADDPGGEGFYYTFTREEIMEELGKEEGEKVCLWFRIEEKGPVEGRSTLYPLGRPDDPVRTLPITAGEPFFPWLKETLKKLAEIRHRRPPPQRDEKGILVQNAYLLLGFCEVLRTPLFQKVKPGLLDLAEKLLHLSRSSPLPRVVYPQEARGEGGLPEYSFLSLAFLYTGLMLEEPRYLEQSRLLLDQAISRFYKGGDWDTQSSEVPWGRVAGYWDGELPPPFAVLLHLLGAFSLILPDRYQEPHSSLVGTLLPRIEEYPQGTQAVTRTLALNHHSLSSLLLPSYPHKNPLPYLPPSILPFFPKTLHWLKEIGSPLPSGKTENDQGYLCTARACEPPIPLSLLKENLKERFSILTD